MLLVKISFEKDKIFTFFGLKIKFPTILYKPNFIM